MCASARQPLKLAAHKRNEAVFVAGAQRVDENARALRLAVGFLGVGERRQADLADVSARQSVVQKRLDGIAIVQSAVRVAQVEMRVQSQKSDAFQRRVRTVHAAVRHRIVAAEHDGQRKILHSLAHSIANRYERFSRGETGDGGVTRV